MGNAAGQQNVNNVWQVSPIIRYTQCRELHIDIPIILGHAVDDTTVTFSTSREYDQV